MASLVAETTGEILVALWAKHGFRSNHRVSNFKFPSWLQGLPLFQVSMLSSILYQSHYWGYEDPANWWCAWTKTKKDGWLGHRVVTMVTDKLNRHGYQRELQKTTRVGASLNLDHWGGETVQTGPSTWRPGTQGPKDPRTWGPRVLRVVLHYSSLNTTVQAISANATSLTHSYVL